MVSSISSATQSAAAQPWQQVRNDYQALSQALSQGDLSSAQKAYTSIQQDQQNGPQLPASSPGASDFTALGQALQSGDLSGAQEAFASIKSDAQQARQARGAGGGKGGGKGGGGGDDSSDSSDAAKTVTNEVTTTNSDGTLTVTTTYSDGTTSSDVQPNPVPTVSQSPLAANSAQLATLLSAQEQQSLQQTS